jgi:hypothetical protein
LIASNPKAIRATQSYQDLALMTFYSESLKQGVDADAHLRLTDDLEITPFKEFMYLPGGRTLMRISQQHNMIEKSGWPAPIMPMRFNYIAKPELLDAPHMKKIQGEDELLCQMFHELALLELVREQEDRRIQRQSDSDVSINLLPISDDVFTDAMQPVWKHGYITMRSVFAARVHLDILDTCRNFNGRQLLHDEGLRQHDDFEFYVDSEGAVDMCSGFRWLGKDERLVMEIYERVTRHMLQPLYGEFKRGMLAEHDKNEAARPQGRKITEEDIKRIPSQYIINQTLSTSLKSGVHDDRPDDDVETKKPYEQNAKKLDIRPVTPNRDISFYMNKNPLYCGTLILSQTVSTEAAGVALANHHLSIFTVAHLYNALRKMELTDIIWPAMEKIMKLHAGPLFADDIPSTPEEMRARFFFRMGVDRTMTRSSDKKTLAKKDLSISHSGTLLQFFRTKQQSLDRTIFQLQEDIEQRNLSATKSRKQTPKPLGVLSQRKFIGQLEEFAQAAIAETKVSYLDLTKRCSRLMQSISKRLQREGYKLPPKPNPHDSNDMSLIFMVAEILHQNSSVNKVAVKGKKAPGTYLQLAAIDYRRMWEKGGLE